jgi:glycosyltransferase involved in cell wall biosynthesis
VKVSVIIPYNRDRGYLGAAIKSIEDQSYSDIEIILSHSCGSGGVNMNAGIEKSTGDLICYLCEDDLLPTNSIRDRVRAMGKFDFIHSWAEYLLPDGQKKPYNLTSPITTFEEMLIRNSIMGGTVMYNRDVFISERWDENLWTGGEYDFNLRLLSTGHRLGFFSKTTYTYRLHSEQKSIGNLSAEYQEKRSEVINEIKARYAPPHSYN